VTDKKLHHMQCSSCRVTLREMTLAGEMVDQCPKCGGTFFDAEELGRVTRRLTERNAAPSDDWNDLWREPVTGDRRCPRCMVAMQASQYSYDSQIPIHKCSSCDGVWLVAGLIDDLVRYRQGNRETNRREQALRSDHEADQNELGNRLDRCLRSRLWSFLTGLLMIAIFALNSGAVGVISYVPILVIGLGSIWYCDFLQYWKSWRIRYTTHPLWIAVGGWMVLLLPVWLWIITGEWPERIHLDVRG